MVTVESGRKCRQPITPRLSARVDTGLTYMHDRYVQGGMGAVSMAVASAAHKAGATMATNAQVMFTLCVNFSMHEIGPQLSSPSCLAGTTLSH